MICSVDQKSTVRTRYGKSHRSKNKQPQCSDLGENIQYNIWFESTEKVLDKNVLTI